MLTSEVPFLPFLRLGPAMESQGTGAQRERGGFLPFYFFTFLPLNKSLLFEGFEETLAHRLAILLCIADVGENLG